MADKIVFEMRDVKVAYGFRNAVDSLSLDLKPGASLGLLGLNGAGKTSTLRALLGMLKPRKGTVRVFDKAPGNTKTLQRIGFAPEDGLPPDYLSADEYLSFIGGLKIKNSAARKAAVKELMDWFELVPGKKLRDYSKGMKKRLILAQAFLGSPDLLILDEPLNGLDPLIIMKLRTRLDEYRKQGGSLLYSSHILSEVEKTCTDIAIMHNGRLLSRTSLEPLLSEYGSVENAFAAQVGKA